MTDTLALQLTNINNTFTLLERAMSKRSTDYNPCPGTCPADDPCADCEA